MSTEAANPKLRVMTMSDGILGGAEDLARQVAQRLDPERFESTLVATRWESSPRLEEILAELDEAGTSFIGMNRGSRFDLRPWRRLVREMREREIDILHTHKIGSNLWGALLKPRVPVPIFVAHEHTWSWEGQLHRRMIDRHLIGRRAAAVIAVSRADQRRMTEIEGIPAAKTRYIPNGIALPKRSDDAADLRAELDLAAETPLVGMVATLRRQKNYDVLIRAAGVLRQRHADAKVLIVGGEEHPGAREGVRLQALIDELGLSETVFLVGYRPDSFDVIRQFDVAVLSSDFEGQPLTVLEYMDAARPIVATAVGGLPDLITDGETGSLVPPRDPQALAAGIEAMLEAPRRATRMGEAARVLRRTEFTVEAMVRRVESLYKELHERTASVGGVRS